MKLQKAMALGLIGAMVGITSQVAYAQQAKTQKIDLELT